ncbi:MAG: PaaI family thioesterase [Bacteroidales bacterium]
MITFNSSIEEINASSKGTLMETLGIEYICVEKGYVQAKMPVDKRTLQPMGLLHGGASLALAETIGSLGSVILVDTEKAEVRGSSLSANHVRAARTGFVIGEAKILHQGSKTHVWNIDIKNEEGKLISSCRLTNFIIEK